MKEITRLELTRQNNDISKRNKTYVLIKNRLDQVGLSAKTQALESIEGGEIVRIEVHARPHVDQVSDDLGQFTLLISVKHMMIGLEIAV